MQQLMVEANGAGPGHRSRFVEVFFNQDGGSCTYADYRERLSPHGTRPARQQPSPYRKTKQRNDLPRQTLRRLRLQKRQNPMGLTHRPAYR